MLGIIPHKENMQFITHCIVYAKSLIHKEGMKIVKLWMWRKENCLFSGIILEKYMKKLSKEQSSNEYVYVLIKCLKPFAQTYTYYIYCIYTAVLLYACWWFVEENWWKAINT